MNAIQTNAQYSEIVNNLKKSIDAYEAAKTTAEISCAKNLRDVKNESFDSVKQQIADLPSSIYYDVVIDLLGYMSDHSYALALTIPRSYRLKHEAIQARLKTMLEVSNARSIEREKEREENEKIARRTAMFTTLKNTLFEYANITHDLDLMFLYDKQTAEYDTRQQAYNNARQDAREQVVKLMNETPADEQETLALKILDNTAPPIFHVVFSIPQKTRDASSQLQERMAEMKKGCQSYNEKMHKLEKKAELEMSKFRKKIGREASRIKSEFFI